MARDRRVHHRHRTHHHHGLATRYRPVRRRDSSPCRPSAPVRGRPALLVLHVLLGLHRHHPHPHPPHHRRVHHDQRPAPRNRQAARLSVRRACPSTPSGCPPRSCPTGLRLL